MRLRTAREMMPLHHALEPFSLGDPHDVHQLAFGKHAHRDGHRLSSLEEHLGHSKLLPQQPVGHSLISTSTPAARLSFIRASIVSGVGSMISMSRLYVRISNCSRDFLSAWVERCTVHLLIRVGNGIGPTTLAPVRFTVSTISATDWSRTR